ncbi:MAG: lipopolysaccharide biosynthesis protein [Geminicoccales bacterium]
MIQNLLRQLRSKASAHDLMSRLMRGAALALMVNVAGFSLGFLAQLVVGRSLGIGGYGVYAYVQAWVSFVAMICGLGLPFALLRFVPEYRGRDEWPLMREVIFYVERRVLVVSLATAVIGALLLTIFGEGLDQEFRWTIYIGLVAMPFLAVLRVWCAVLRAFGRIVSSLGSDLPVREGFTFLAVAVFGLGFALINDAIDAMVVWTLGTVIGALISLTVWRRQQLPEAWHDTVEISADTRAHWLQVALLLLVVQSLAMMIRRLDLFVVGWWFEKEDLGVYAAANRLAEIMIFPTYVLNAYFAPTISELYSKSDLASLQKATTLTANMALGSALILVLPLLLFPEEALGLFGQDFTRGATALRYLAGGEFVATAIPFATMMLTMTGHERAAVKLMCVASIGTFLLMMMAAATGTIETVAMARAAAVIMIQLSFCWLILKTTKISPFPLIKA